MKNAKHTPAPWRVIETDFHPGDHVADLSNGLMVIATANLGDPLADALLIACAPELLEACQLFVAYEKASDFGNHIMTMLAYKTAHDAIHAAISKATGEKA